MYLTESGTRHIESFIFITFFVMPLFYISEENNKIKKGISIIVIVGVMCFALLCFEKMLEGPEYIVPYSEDARKEDLETLKEQLENNMELKDQVGYGNTVIWMYDDTVNGVWAPTDYNAFYMIPVGYGINCCLNSYVLSNWDSLKSGYIAVTVGSDTEKKCIENNYNKVGSSSTLVVYKII